MSDNDGSIQLDVPYVSQGDDDVGCVWACIKMIIEYHVARHPDLPNLDVQEVMDGVGYGDDGTRLDGVTGINRRLRGPKHELVFETLEYSNFSDIEREVLIEKRPVIAWIKQNRESDIHHSIVVKGVNSVDLRVYVNDPDSDEPSEHKTSDFINAWETGDRILIRAHIRDRPTQRRLDESP